MEINHAQKGLNPESGATLIGYTVILVVLIPVFVFAGNLFASSSIERGDIAIESSTYLIPCASGTKLNPSECL